VAIPTVLYGCKTCTLSCKWTFSGVVDRKYKDKKNKVTNTLTVEE